MKCFSSFVICSFTYLLINQEVRTNTNSFLFHEIWLEGEGIALVGAHRFGIPRSIRSKPIPTTTSPEEMTSVPDLDFVLSYPTHLGNWAPCFISIWDPLIQHCTCRCKTSNVTRLLTLIPTINTFPVHPPPFRSTLGTFLLRRTVVTRVILPVGSTNGSEDLFVFPFLYALLSPSISR